MGESVLRKPEAGSTRILITGKNGQLVWPLAHAFASSGEVVAFDRDTLNLPDPDTIRRACREFKPTLILNAGAYTAVDRAEQEQELAMQINGVAPRVLAEEANRLGAAIIHYSTDYVFAGDAACRFLLYIFPRHLVGIFSEMGETWNLFFRLGDRKVGIFSRHRDK